MSALSVLEFLATKILLDIQQLQNCSVQLKIQQGHTNQMLSILGSLEMDDLIFIMTTCTQKTLFIILALLNAQIKQMKNKAKICQLFQYLNSLFKNWCRQTDFLRNQLQNKLQFYHEGVIGSILGTLYKLMSLQNNMESWNKIIKQIKSIDNKFYQMFAIKNYFSQIQTMEIDESIILGKLFKNFQTEIITEIINLLVVNIKQIKNRKINNQLSKDVFLSQQQELKHIENNQMSENDIKQLKILFQILKQIVTFDYEVSYSQEDPEFLQTKYGDCKCISFPDNVILPIIKQQFIKQLYFIIQKLLCVTNFSKNLNQQRSVRSSFIQISFDLLQKIIKTKITHHEYAFRKSFIISILQGQNQLIKIKSNPYVMQRIMQSNCKLIRNVQLPQILQHQEGRSWLNHILIYSKLIIEQMNVTFKNKLAQKTIKLLKDIILQAILYELDVNLKQQNLFTFLFHFQKLYFLNLLQRQNLIFQQNIGSIQQLQQQKQYFFRDIKTICGISLKQLNNNIECYLQQGNSVNKVSKFFMFISEIVTNSFLNTQKIYFQMECPDVHNFGKNILNCLGFIQRCLEEQIIFKNKQNSKYLFKNSIYFVIHRLLQQNLQFVIVSQSSMKILSKIYSSIEGHIMTDNYLKFKNQGFFYQLFTYLFKIVRYSNQQEGVFILQKIKPLLIKYKNYVLKLNQKCSQYFQALKKDFQSLRLTEQTFRSILYRKTLSQMVPILFFTNIRMDIRMVLQKQAAKLKKQSLQQSWMLSTYEFCGLIQSIQKEDIFYYFVEKIGKDHIQLIISRCFENYTQSTISILFQISHIFINKQTKRPKNIVTKLSILSMLIPIWNQIIKIYLQNPQKAQFIEQVLETFKDISSDEFMNFYILQKHPLLMENFKNYLNYISHFMSKIIYSLQEYNIQIQKKLLINCKILIKILGDYLVSSTNQTKVWFEAIIISITKFFVKVLRNEIYFKIHYISLISRASQVFFQILSYFQQSTMKLHKLQAKSLANKYFQTEKALLIQILNLLFFYKKGHKHEISQTDYWVSKIKQVMIKIYGTKMLAAKLSHLEYLDLQNTSQDSFQQKQFVFGQNIWNEGENTSKIQIIAENFSSLSIKQTPIVDEY